MRTPLCDLLDIEVPIIQAAIWPATSPELVAAVGAAGAIGSLGAVFTPAERLRASIEAIRSLTDRPFIVNHVVPQLDADAFRATLDARPAAVSFALGDPGELVEQAHDAGSLAIQQVHTVGQARAAAALGVDVIIAQGAEAGGQGLSGGPSTMVLVPQVVQAVAPIPVVAAGGVADGRGMAAALVLGAAGVNVGTRFLASEEAASDPEWRRRIVEAGSEDAVRFEAWSEIFPRRAGGYPVVPRALPTAFTERWRDAHRRTGADAADARAEIADALARNAPHEVVPVHGTERRARRGRPSRGRDRAHHGRREPSGPEPHRAVRRRAAAARHDALRLRAETPVEFCIRKAQLRR